MWSSACWIAWSGVAAAAPSAGWPDSEDFERPRVVLFEEVPPPADEGPPRALVSGTELPLEWSVEIVADRPADVSTVTLVGVKSACVAPVTASPIVRVRAWPPYQPESARVTTRLARQVDASACPPEHYYFGVVGDSVDYEVFGAVEGVPPEVARVVPGAVDPFESTGGHPLGDTWLAYTPDGHGVLVRDGALRPTDPAVDDGVGVVHVDGRTWLFAGTTWESRAHVLVDVGRDPIPVVAIAGVDPVRKRELEAHDETIRERNGAAAEQGPWRKVLTAFVGVLATAPIGGLVGALVGRGRGALRGALVAPIGALGLVSTVVWGALTVIAVFLLVGEIDPHPGGGWITFDIPLSTMVWALVLGSIGVLGPASAALAALLSLVPRARTVGRFGLVAASVVIVVQHALWVVIAVADRRTGELVGPLLPLLAGAVSVAMPLALALVTPGTRQP